MVIEHRYEHTETFSGGRALVGLSNTDEFVIDRSGKVVFDNKAQWNLIDQSEGGIRVLSGRQYGFLDDKGRSLQHFYRGADRFSDGMARVYNSFSGPYGYIDREGKEVIPLKFPTALDFSEGLAAAAKPN